MIRVRAARPDDVEALHGLITELAAYERAADEVLATPADLERSLFAPSPAVHAHVAELVEPELAPQLVGMAIWFVTYSTWLGRHGLWLEDLYVTPGARRLGAGRALLQTLARECRARDYGRLEWWVLDWNEPALAFYRKLGAIGLDDWTVHRLEGSALLRMAADVPAEQLGGHGSASGGYEDHEDHEDAP